MPEIHVASPKGSIARAIEQNLLREGSGHRLDSLLFETVTERVRAAHECYRRVLQDHGDRIAELMTCWRREWDSNPRYGFPHTRFPSVRLKPLGHLSGCSSLEGA